MKISFLDRGEHECAHMFLLFGILYSSNFDAVC